MTLLDFCTDRPLRSFASGETVIHENRTDGRLFVLRKGVVEVKLRDTTINRISSPGSVFGEIAVLLGCAHTASVAAVEPSEFYLIDDAEQMLRQKPDFLFLIAQILANRMRNLTSELVEIREQIEVSGEDEPESFHEVMRALVDHHIDREF